jgi:hypothetical protein
MNGAVRSAFSAIVVVLAVGIAAGRANAAEFPLWGNLPIGSCSVGFSSHWEFDFSRAYNTKFADKSSYATGKAPRPILINIWYPARPNGRQQPMRHGDYLAILSEDRLLAKFTRELAQYERRVITKEVMQKPAEQLTPAEKQLFDQFLETRTACLRNIEPAAGKFPLVIYHAGFGSSFEDNSVLCEFLASHGFVVLGSAYQEPSGKSFNVDGEVTSGRDIDFLIAYARRLPYVDWQHIAVIGHSGGAHAALMYRAQPSSALDAVISLDTTQDYYGTGDPRWDRLTSTVTKNRQNFTGPLLIVANPHAFFELCDSLEASRRYYLTIRDLDHDEFISQGRIADELRLQSEFGGEAKSEHGERRAKAQAHVLAVRQANESLCTYALRFLEAELKGDKRAQDDLLTRYRDTPLGSVAPHVEYVAPGVSGPSRYKESDGRLPTPRQLRPFLKEHGVEKTIALLGRAHKQDPGSPLLHQVFAFALVSQLLDQGQKSEAAALCRFFDHEGCGTTQLFTDVGDLYLRLGAKQIAAHFFQQSLTLNPDNAAIAAKLRQCGKAEK